VSKARRLIVVAIAVALVSTVALAGAVFLLRAGLSPAIRVENASNHSLEQVTCTLFADGITWTEKIDELKPGESVKFTKFTSDLFVQSVKYRVQGEPRQWREGGIATTGETLILQIGDQDDVSLSYGKW